MSKPRGSGAAACMCLAIIKVRDCVRLCERGLSNLKGKLEENCLDCIHYIGEYKLGLAMFVTSLCSYYLTFC